MRFSRRLFNVARGWTELPELPANVGMIFPSNLTIVRPFYVTGWKWGLMFTAMCSGLYFGQVVGMKVLTRSNPPNPPRLRDADKPPKRHPHTPEEE